MGSCCLGTSAATRVGQPWCCSQLMEKKWFCKMRPSSAEIPRTSQGTVPANTTPLQGSRGERRILPSYSLPPTGRWAVWHKWAHRQLSAYTRAGKGSGNPKGHRLNPSCASLLWVLWEYRQREKQCNQQLPQKRQEMNCQGQSAFLWLLPHLQSSQDKYGPGFTGAGHP